MNDAQPTLASQSHDRGRFVWLLVLAVYLALTLFQLGRPDVEIDEGRFGLAALNILRDPRQLAIVAQRPDGDPGTMPYFYPLAIAASLGLLGKTEFALRLVNVVALLVGALLLFQAVNLLLRDRLAALVALAAFALNAGTIVYARSALPEAFVVACGCAALFVTVRAHHRQSLVWAALGGVLLGLGFLSKLWLIGPFVLACVGLPVIDGLRLCALKVRLTLVLLVTFLLTASSHLLLVIALAPEWLPHWLDTYWAFTLKSRAAGVGYDPDMWYRPWWFYFAALFKASFFGLPFLFLGIARLRTSRNTRLGWITATLLLPVIPLSVFRVKQASYIFFAYPALAILLALGVAAFVRAPSSERPRLATASLLSLLVSLFFFAQGAFSPWELGALLLLYLTYASLTLVPRKDQAPAAVVLALFVAALLVPGILMVKKTLLHRTHYREIATYFRDQLESTRIDEVAFVAPESPAMEFYTFRRGTYWETYYYREADDMFTERLKHRPMVFYVADPSAHLYGGRVSPGKLRALEEHGTDITAAVEGTINRPLAVKIFTSTRPRLIK